MINQAAAYLWAKISVSHGPRDELKAHIDGICDLLRSASGYPSGWPRYELHSEVAVDEADAIARAIVANAAGLPAAADCYGQDAQATLGSLFGALLASGPELEACLDVAARALNHNRADVEVDTTATIDERRSLAELCRQLAAGTGISDALLAAIVSAQAMLFLVESEGEQLDVAEIIDGDDETVLGEAIALLKEALERSESQLTSMERAHAERALGRARCLYFDLTGHRTKLADAIASKARAHDLYEHLGNLIMASDIAAEIDTLKEVKCQSSSEEVSDRAEQACRARGDTTLRNEPIRLEVAGASRPCRIGTAL